MSKREPHRKRTSPLPLIFLLLAVILVWAIYWLLMIRAPFHGEFWDARGKFGDMFGAFNALFTACAFAAVTYGIRLEYKASLRQELHSALSAQLDTLVQLYALPEAQRAPVWRAIVAAPGGPGEDFPIERAIANQIDFMDRLMAGEEMGLVPTYGRPPKA